MFNGGAACNNSASPDSGVCSDKGRRQNARAFFNDGLAAHPDARPDLLSGRAGLCLAGKDINGKLAEIASSRQRIHVSGIFDERALAAAAAELAAEQRCSVIAARGTDAEDIQLATFMAGLAYPAAKVKMELHQLRKVDLSIGSQPDQHH